MKPQDLTEHMAKCSGKLNKHLVFSVAIQKSASWYRYHELMMDSSVEMCLGLAGLLLCDTLFSELAEKMAVAPSLSSDGLVALIEVIHSQRPFPRQPTLP